MKVSLKLRTDAALRQRYIAVFARPVRHLPKFRQIDCQNCLCGTRTLVKQHGLHRQTVMLVLIGQSGIVRRLYIALQNRIAAVREQQRKPALLVCRREIFCGAGIEGGSGAPVPFFQQTGRSCLLCFRSKRPIMETKEERRTVHEYLDRIIR